MSDHQTPDPSTQPVIPDLRQAARDRQSVLLAVVGGLGGAIVSTGVWVLVFALTGFNTFLFAFLVGIVVGLSTWALGRGCSPSYGLIGAALAIGSTMLAYVLIVQMIQATNAQTPFFTQLTSQSPVAWFQAYFQGSFVPLHLFAYIIAGLEGYSLAFRKV